MHCLHFLTYTYKVHSHNYRNPQTSFFLLHTYTNFNIFIHDQKIYCLYLALSHKHTYNALKTLKFEVNVTIYSEGLTDMAASNWLTSMVENNP